MASTFQSREAAAELSTTTNTNKMPSSGENTVLSGDRDVSEVPKMSLPEFLLAKLRAGLDTWGHKPFMVDVTAGTQVKFCDVESQSRRVASALSRRGFKKGHVLYFVTYEMAQLCVVQLAVWRLGGAMRGCYQGETTAEYARQIIETSSRFVLVDAETAPKLQEATASLEWPVVLLSVGDVTVPGATSFSQLLEDDGTAFPEKVEVNPLEDVLSIVNTSGSTGMPKGVLHTHYSLLAFIKSLENVLPNTSMMEPMITYGIGVICFFLHGICCGLTVYHVGKFKREEYFDHLLKYKPRNVLIYPYVASWVARCGPELAKVREADFLDGIWVGGWVLDHTTAALITKELPRCLTRQVYGMTEITFFTMTDASGAPASVENQGQLSVSSGKLLPYAQAKIVDLASGAALGRGEVGEIHVRSPCVMLGYLQPGSQKPNRAGFDQEGWFGTGDIGFFDDNGNLYVKERKTFMFKYFMNYVSPCEIEVILQEHEAVQAAGVVGVPHPESDNLARAFVVLRPDCHATADELQNFVAQRLPPYKHLHGGVRFVDKLPLGKGDKMDRVTLKKLALQE